MRASLSAGLAAFVLSAACFAGNTVRGSGRAQRERRDVGAFDAVAVQSGIHATISIGEKLVEVKADDNVLPLVVTEVKDGTLEIGFEKNTWLMSEANVEVKVRTPKLRAVQASGGAEAKVESSTSSSLTIGASGGAHVSIERTPARELQIRASGGSTVDAAGLDAAELDASGSGGAVLRLGGRAAQAHLSFSGGTDIKATSLEVDKLVVQGSGGGEARLRVAQAIKGSLSGGSTLHVGGNPRSEVNTSGGAEVVYEDGHRARSSRHDEDDDD
jgi:hypothetical protein